MASKTMIYLFDSDFILTNSLDAGAYVVQATVTGRRIDIACVRRVDASDLPQQYVSAGTLWSINEQIHEKFYEDA